ncbi:alkaline phosphatase family protein [Flavilitoribacter nigricans]|uniref:Nucleotide pyrophosphatase n=1 Tax=Flavilitoribacter nigricans (strain ATCC 23147 / DSM 23189 / NBRC 102662 / NCIMB 1420 / SS-2) TaxID=1122177 RepID=A0A2D0N9X0_FLAN2|nr:alkaline phosphatase family protein [Flavilitoribacter nigricans]PHN04583.1 nucleotide pyrophosphatase [Flavilitoribacter nigricans DSM 23189 = NBRC 102662]
MYLEIVNQRNTFRLLSLLFGLALITVPACRSTRTEGANAAPITPAKRVIILGLDGLSVPGYQTADHPHLDRLLADGSISFTTRTVMPSVTLPNWTSHLTGSGPEQHGVDGNNWTLAEHALPPIEQDAQGYAPSIFKLLKEQLPAAKTAYYYNWGNLIHPINQKYLDEVSFEEDDGYEQNYEKAFHFAVANRDQPTLIFLYSVHVDHAGHQHEWMSPQYIEAIEAADLAIGRLIDQLKAEDLYRDTHFFLITDHGGQGKGHGGMSPVEMNVPWAVSGPGIQKAQGFTEPNNNTNTAVVIARLFGLQQLPKSWVGKIPESVFQANR